MTEHPNKLRTGTRSSERDLLVQEMMNHVAILQRRFQSEGEDEERTWMMENTDDPAVRSFLREASVVMLHVLDAVGELGPVNGITIAKTYGIPRGSVSKITRRLAALHMVETESLKDNKKEVLFRLTPLGHRVFTLHRQLHLRIEQNVRHFLNRYDLEQMKFIVQCLQDTAAASWVAGEAAAVESATADKREHGNEETSLGPLSEPVQPTEEMAEILAMLQQMDERKLKKTKDLLRIIFF